MEFFVKDAHGRKHVVEADDYEVDTDGELVMLAENEDGELAEIGRFPNYTAVVQYAEEGDEDEGEEVEDDVEDAGNVRLGGFAPTINPTHDTGKVRMGGGAIVF